MPPRDQQIHSSAGHFSSAELRRFQGSLLMAKPKALRQTLDSYTVKRINKTIKAGDCVLMRPSEPSKPSYVAKIEKIEADSRGANVKVHVRWYYRPEESIGGRRQFHGSKELFLSDHYDVQSADTIEGKCTVHTFKNYTKLDAVGNEDYFSRFDYNSATGAFTPDRVAVYCKCEMPYNPDDLMVQCERCSDWFHPACIEMSAEKAKKLDHFFCESCSPEGQKKLQNSQSTSKIAETKVDSKRRRR
ncbi:chromatin remodeling protein SHL isoform X3 [Cucurbita maxima]|uniref:Chromatin remodeling protein SHL isoform X3 n=3 Tax=Cucurbita maxima TaxID=3661 RepID=A0A6J1I8K6_CUCMA|nr:chromatin remodeling protein SHL isoform X3 [Cucurbita maxima]